MAVRSKSAWSMSSISFKEKWFDTWLETVGWLNAVDSMVNSETTCSAPSIAVIFMTWYYLQTQDVVLILGLEIQSGHKYDSNCLLNRSFKNRPLNSPHKTCLLHWKTLSTLPWLADPLSPGWSSVTQQVTGTGFGWSLSNISQCKTPLWKVNWNLNRIY